MTVTEILERQEASGVGGRNQGIRETTGPQGLRRTTMFRKTQHIHLVGIGGSGMSGIAEVLLTLGYKITAGKFSSATRNPMWVKRRWW